MNRNQLILEAVADHAVSKTETPSESFALYRRDLLESNDYSVVMVPVFSAMTMVDLCQTVRLCAYLKNRYQCELILVVDPRFVFAQVFYLFEDVYDKLFMKKRLVELETIANAVGVTKLIYQPADRLYFDESPVDVITSPIKLRSQYLIESEHVNPMEYVDYVFSGDLTAEVARKMAKHGMVTANETLAFVGSDNLLQDIYRIVMSGTFVYLGHNRPIDYVAPFVGRKIIQVGSPFYENPLFRFSLSYMEQLISTV